MNQVKGAKKIWTKEEDEFLKANYMTMSYTQLAEILHCSKAVIAFRVNKTFKLVKNPKIQIDHNKNKKTGTQKSYSSYLKRYFEKS
jgi:hypothetical protein